MMLEQIERKQEAMRKMLQDSWLSDMVAGVVGLVWKEGSPKSDLRTNSTIGVHIQFDLRMRLRAQQERWGFNTYRDTVYTAVRVGLEALEKMVPPVKS